MLWTLFVVLVLAWMICVLAVGITGAAIHFLLVLAVIVVCVKLFSGKGLS